MQTYFIPHNRRIPVRGLLSFKGEAQTIKYDFSAWAEDNGDVSAVTWTVKSGNATIANKSLSSNIAQAVITTADWGASMIKLVAIAGNNTYVTHLRILAKDPDVVTEDYGVMVG